MRSSVKWKKAIVSDRFGSAGPPAGASLLLRSPNVVGVLRGSDPVLRNQYLVYSAHLDHLGIGAPVKGDRIYNGAADDASGCAALIVLAHADLNMDVVAMHYRFKDMVARGVAQSSLLARSHPIRSMGRRYSTAAARSIGWLMSSAWNREDFLGRTFSDLAAEGALTTSSR